MENKGGFDFAAESENTDHGKSTQRPRRMGIFRICRRKIPFVKLATLHLDTEQLWTE